MSPASRRRIVLIMVLPILILVSFFSFHPGLSEAESGFLEWLKGIMEIRSPAIVLCTPHGKTFLKDPMVFRWGAPQDPDHFVIRVKEEDFNDLNVREVWVSAAIPGNRRFFEASLQVSDPHNKSYRWELEVYMKDQRGTAFRSQTSAETFSFLSPEESADVMKEEAVFLGWIQERPKENHLFLLFGSYYAWQHMYSHAGEMFAKFLSIDDCSAFSYKALTGKLHSQLAPAEKRRDSLQTAVRGVQNQSERFDALRKLLDLDLLLLDYDQALWCVNELIVLSSQEQEDIKSTWLRKKKDLMAEQKIASKIFPR